ncbi:type II toxin-antitoxin system VapC family toxin [candidate division KSB1 bacterium]|nr:type II toxin-antitoxin system VapC family toxin [candidate division KSB1 bacterium]
MINSRLRIFDTDTLSLAQRRNPLITSRLQQLPSTQTAVTIVTIEEQMRGWVAQIKQEKKLERLILTYAKFQDAVLSYSRMHVLPFDEEAANHFQKLQYLQTRLGMRDLRIAAIALAFNGVLVTANIRHFRQIPGLTIEDWTAT